MSNSEFTNTFLDFIRPGYRVLDLGAGEGHFSRLFAERGASVTAVDPESPISEDKSIIAAKMKIEEYIHSKNPSQYDMVFMRNFIQFLDKQWVFETLFPWIDKHLNQGGIIGIETFYRDPRPPFSHLMRSLYKTRELSDHFFSWQELYAKENEYDGPDLDGVIRHFFISDLIIKKVR